MFKGSVSLKSHPELDEDVVAFVKRGPELVDSEPRRACTSAPRRHLIAGAGRAGAACRAQPPRTAGPKRPATAECFLLCLQTLAGCHLDNGRTLDQLTKEEQLHLLKMQADRTEALEALQALNRADAAALNATGAKTLAEAAKRAADAKKHSLVITQKLSEVSRIRANQLAAQAALGAAKESAETTSLSVQGAIEMSKQEREAAAVAKKAKAAAPAVAPKASPATAPAAAPKAAETAPVAPAQAAAPATGFLQAHAAPRLRGRRTA